MFNHVDKVPSLALHKPSEILLENGQHLMHVDITHTAYMRGNEKIIHAPEGMISRQGLLPEAV